MSTAKNYTEKNLFSDGESLFLWEKIQKRIYKKTSKTTFHRNKTLNQAVKTRLTQFLAVNGLPELKQFVNAKEENIFAVRSGNWAVEVDEDFGVTFNGHNLIWKSKRHRTAEWLKFMFNWICCLMLIFIRDVKVAVSPVNSATLLFGCAEQNISSAVVTNRIENFLKSTPLGKVPHSSHYIFKSSKIFTQCGNALVFTRLPDLALIYKSKLEFRTSLTLALEHLAWLFVCIKLFTSRPILINFASEFGTAIVMKRLAERGFIDAFVHSTGNVTAHPISARFYKLYETHSLYYNIVPTNPTLICDLRPEKSSLDPPLLWSNAGTHWVWTEADKRLMSENYMIDDVNVIGIPSLFYPKFIAKNKLRNVKKYDIVIFDVTPHLDEAIKKNKVTFYYGKYETASKLLIDVIEAASLYSVWSQGPPLRIALKPKRKDHQTNDPRYWETIDNLVIKHQNFRVLQDDYDINQLISECDLFISRPFTSAAHLVALNGKASIFYDPTGQIIDNCVKIQNLSFVNSVPNLFGYLKSQKVNLRREY